MPRCCEYYLIAGYFRWYNILKCPRPALCGAKLPGKDHRPVCKKVFKSLRQNANAYGCWTVCIESLSHKNTLKFLFVAEWIGSQVWASSRTDSGGRNTRNHLWVLTPQRSDHIQRQGIEVFLRRLLVSPDNFNPFDNKLHALSVTLPGHL